jgi:hypothetical protein
MGMVECEWCGILCLTKTTISTEVRNRKRNGG